MQYHIKMHSRIAQVKFLKAAFHKFYLVHSFEYFVTCHARLSGHLDPKFELESPTISLEDNLHCLVTLTQICMRCCCSEAVIQKA